MTVCPWCAAKYETFQTHCTDCGGHLPTPPGEDAGPPPPKAPRTLPAGFRRRVLVSRNVQVIVGGVFSLIGARLMFGFGLAGAMGEPSLLLPAGFGTIFFTVGALVFRSGWRSAQTTLAAFERGIAALGTVKSVYCDTSVKINGRSPWAIEYVFEAGGPFSGKARTWDETASERKPGQPIHVLYLPEDPSE